jgi:hypothetical protein
VLRLTERENMRSRFGAAAAFDSRTLYITRRPAHSSLLTGRHSRKRPRNAKNNRRAERSQASAGARTRPRRTFARKTRPILTITWLLAKGEALRPHADRSELSRHGRQ